MTFCSKVPISSRRIFAQRPKDSSCAQSPHTASSVVRTSSQGSDGAFTDTARTEGLNAATLRSLTFGVAPQDFDHDGRLDLALANGHIEIHADRRDNGSRRVAITRS